MHITSSDIPERNLMAAILIRAILDLHSAWPDEVKDARQWLTGIINDPDGVSFEEVCCILDLDPDITLMGALNPKSALSERVKYRMDLTDGMR